MTRIQNNLAMQQWLASKAKPVPETQARKLATALPQQLEGKAIQFGLDRVLQVRPSSLALPASKGQIHKMVQQVLDRIQSGRSESIKRCSGSVVDEVVGSSDRINKAQRDDLLKLVESTASLVVRRGNELAKEGMGIEKAAKDFEGLFFNQLIGSMRKTIDDEGLLEGDGTGKQMRDLYWMFLGQQASQSGSLGMWKQIAAEMSEHGNLTSASADLEV